MRAKTLAAAVAAVAALAVPASASATTTLIGSGSVAAQPVLLPLFKQYQKVTDVQQGKSQFAGQARPPTTTDLGTTYIQLYLDGLCIDTNPANHLTNIDMGSLANIYLGNTTNWSGIAGSGLSTTIDPVGRDTNGGTYTFFKQAVLNNANPASNVNALVSDGLVVNAVKGDPNSIGYSGLAWQGAGMNTVSLNGVKCAPKFVHNFSYPLTRFIWIVLPSSGANPLVSKFANWVRRDPVAGQIIAKAGGVPYFNKKAKKKGH